MRPGYLWRSVDPTVFSDGVLFLPEMVEIQPRESDWGVPDKAGLRARVDGCRPHGTDESKGKLLCLLCMARNAHAGKASAPVWMYMRQRPDGKDSFCHADKHEPHPEHEPESPEHKALVDREVGTCQLVGASVNTEVWAANGRRRADFIAVGPEVTLAGEVQLSPKSPAQIGRRQRDLASDGKRVVWTTHNVGAEFLAGVPRLVVPALSRGWKQVRDADQLPIVSGLVLVEYRRCGWADTWSGTNRCPRTRSAVPCGRIHAYPTATADTQSYRPTGELVTQIRMGKAPHLDYVIGGIVTGGWLPYARKVKNQLRFVWMPAEDYPRFVEDRGGAADPKSAERNAGPGHVIAKPAARTCENAAGGGGGLRTIIPPVRSPVPKGVCNTGVTPCGAPARPYACGWRCEQHKP